MKRSVYCLVLVVVVAIMAARSASRHWSAYRVHKAEEVAKAAELAESKKWADLFAKLARECDEVVIEYYDRRNKSDNEIKFSDPVWIANFATVLEAASFTRSCEQYLLMRMRPQIRLYKKQVELLSIEGFTIRGVQAPGEFSVATKPSSAIDDLIRSKIPDQGQ